MASLQQGKLSKEVAEPEEHRYNNIDVGRIRRQQIISAVRQIIARDGLEAVTIANIATELGTSRGVVVYHFDNKNAILHEVLSSAMKDADASALRFEQGSVTPNTYAGLVEQVAKLARSSSDWWKVYFTFLARAHVNEFYRDALAWSDQRYRGALRKRLGDDSKATIVLGLMKGLAMQTAVNPDLPIEPVVQELRELMQTWTGQNESASR